MSRFIHNYLRSARKRAGFSQEDIAFLLGCHSGAKVSRYENLTREPNLHTALACQAVYRVPVHELFPGIYTLVEKQVKRRAFVLKSQLDTEGNEVLLRQKCAFLESLELGIEPEEVRHVVWENPKQLPLF